MKLFWFLILLAFPVLAQSIPPMPAMSDSTKLLSPKHAEHLLSLGSPMLKASATGGTAQFIAPTMLWIAWNYPADQLTNVVFDVYHAYTLTNTPPLTQAQQIPNNFSLLSTVDSTTQLSITASQAAEFFIVRARDKVSGVVSNWNVP